MCRRLIYAIPVVLVLGLVLTSVAEAADPNLVAWWKLDDGAGDTALDSSGNGHHGTLGGAPQWANGFFDGALAFGGNGDYVEIPYNPGLALNEFTISAWVKLAVEPGTFGVHGTRSGGEYTFDWKVMDTYIHGDIGDGGAWLNTAIDIAAGDTGTTGRGGDLELDTWYAIAYVIDNTNQEVRLYLDGDLKQTIAISGTPLLMQSGQTMRIGHTGYGTEWMNGLIDDVRIYDRALSSDEVQAIVPPKYKAYKPDPPDGTEGVETPLLKWTAGDTAISHNVYFGTSPTLGEADLMASQAWAVYWHTAGIEPGVTYYWRIDEVEPNGAVHTGDVWSFLAAPLIAWKPDPADGATDVWIDAELSWNAGGYSTLALKHHVFFGTDAAEVADGTGDTDKGILDDPSYDPGTLEIETVYYFRVNEVEADGTEREGDLWSFETVAAGPGKVLREWWLGTGGTAVTDLTGDARYPDDPDGAELLDLFDGPVNWDDNYGSRLSGWLYPPATGGYTFWLATDDGGECWLSADEDPANTVMICEVTGWVGWRQFDNESGEGGTNQQSAAIPLEAGKRYYIEALMKEGSGGDNIAVAWRGPGIPVREVISAEYVGPTPYLPERAYSPSPADGAPSVSDAAVISWQAGVNAVQHDVYFGTGMTAVADANTTTTGVYRGRLSTTSYVPPESPLEWGTTYYLRIDEVNNDATITPGRLWSFTVADYILIDDFEDYNDYSPGRIFQTWIDGFGYTDPPPGKEGNGTGSTVGYLSAPFAEQTIVHGGGQSMPFGYDNTGAGGKARYSEAEREYLVAQDFSRRGVKSISLWVYGDSNNVPATFYVGLQDSTGTRVDVPDNESDKLRMSGWQEINIDLSDFSPVDLLSITKIYLGVGNRLSPMPGPTGNLFVDDIRLYGPRCVASVLKPADDLNDDCVVDYLDLDIVVNEWLTSGHVVTPADPGTAGLVAHYALDGNTNDSVGGFHGTPNGGPTYGPGQVGQAIRLDGVDDYVAISSLGISGSDARTIACWAKADSTAITDWSNIFGFSGPSANGQHFDFEIVGGTTGTTAGWFGLHVYGWERNILPNDLEWHHLAASHDGTTARWYGDGRLVGSGAVDINSPGNVHMGKREDNENYFPGSVDEARIFNRVLSDAEVAHLAGLTAPFSAAFDLNADDTVDFLDVGVLGDAWLEELLWPAGP